MVRGAAWVWTNLGNRLVIESVECYGMPVGTDVIETCYWIGRFDRDETAILMPRREVKLHLCGDSRAADPNVRQALIDRFGGKAALSSNKCGKCKGKGWFGAGRPPCPKCGGTPPPPGPLYGIKTHLWSALALAVTYYDKETDK